ncbi:MAG: leucine-rich repeat domain-containing protein [Alphaproteobacteria bacterium]|nr:leucine-rich repeat domain-containing protein [Alphaproteobacteria bacterium]
MKKSLLVASFAIISTNVFCSPEGQLKLYQMDSPRSQLDMKDVSEIQTSFPQTYHLQEDSVTDEENHYLRKRKKVIYIQDDSWPWEEDNSQDPDYSPRAQRKRKKPIRNNNSIHSFENIFEDVLAPCEPSSSQPNLRKRLKVISGSEYSQFPEKILQDLNDSDHENMTKSIELITLDLDDIPSSSADHDLRSEDSDDERTTGARYNEKKLNVIKNSDILREYTSFDVVEYLSLTLRDLEDASKFKFPNLKELSVDVLIKQAKPKSPQDLREKKLRQLTLEEVFSKKTKENYTTIVNKKKATAESESRINKKKSIYQLLSKGLPRLLSKNLNIEKFSIQHINCEPLPSQIWNLEKLKSLTLKMLGMNELSPEIRNLAELEVLDLSNNKIKALPKEIGELENLKELYLISNHLLEKFPNVIEQLYNLEVLNIDAKQAELWEKDLQRLKEINQNLKIEIW